MAKELLNKVEGLVGKYLYSNLIEALTDAVKVSNVKAVYNYPGRPATYLVDSVRKKYPEIDVQDYLPNEFVAAAKGFGSSVAGCERSLVIFKDVGSNVACDHFYCLNHIGINRGLVFFISDDPSAWASQNEEDSRGLYFNAGLPILEPNDPYSAFYSLVSAYEFSEIFRLPFFVRTTGRAIAEKYDPQKNDFNSYKLPFAGDIIDIPFDAKDKWKSIFATVEEDREELALKQKQIMSAFEESGLNVIKGKGKLGIIASGFPATQLENEHLIDEISLLKLVTLYPLPEKTIIDFIKDKDRVLVVDQGEPLLELLVRDCAQRNAYVNPILGKLNGFVRKVGELRDEDLKISVNALKNNKYPGTFPKHKQIARAPAFDEKDSFKIMLECLREAVKTVGCRPLYCGDAGQSSRVPETPAINDLLHMETTMGCSVSYLSGGIEAYQRTGTKVPFKGIAYVGDSDFFHSAFPGICEAASKDHPILMLVVDNQGAVSTGKQPHLGMKIKSEIKELSIGRILESIDVNYIQEANVKDKKDLIEKLITGLKSEHFYVVIVHVIAS
ncbi:MAG: hypothetical protein A3B68_00265 [Candidatus Melainabacteria bacterium RIFCSPHIGHO2_02_FULL_34_12]|nr:MAG: hypothetical protein A3B68_00265 [Candidatus Melainabacteria bacterium RIFCSPHIGHO2_02_FULL_34_12]